MIDLNAYQPVRQANPGIARKYYKYAFHVFLVGIIYLFWTVYAYRSVRDLSSFLRLFSFASVYVVIVYLNVFVLFKKLFLKGAVKSYVWTTMATFFSGTLILQWIYAPSWRDLLVQFSDPAFYTETFIHFVKCITFTGLGIVYMLFDKWMEGERRIAILENSNLKAELDNLKSQVSPHFLFNTLNNLYVLTKTKPALASQVVLELSDLMRYQLYDCSYEKLPLQKEMDYVKNLLSLEMLRKDKWVFNIDFPDDIPAGIYIEPLLFITLVENAVKHGTQQLETGIIEISMEVQPEQIIFRLVNSKPAAMPENTQKARPIGLNNLKRRLDLLYPQRHQLILSNEDDIFVAILILQL